jgi:hypothetical protein
MTWRSSDASDSRGPRPAAASLDRIVQSLGGPSASSLSDLFGRWKDVAGPELAAHTRPMSLVDSVLTVAVDDPAWAAQLAYAETGLVARSAAILGAGAVTRVRVRVRPR